MPDGDKQYYKNEVPSMSEKMMSFPCFHVSAMIVQIIWIAQTILFGLWRSHLVFHQSYYVEEKLIY